jgi:hypothetical protein
MKDAALLLQLSSPDRTSLSTLRERDPSFFVGPMLRDPQALNGVVTYTNSQDAGTVARNLGAPLVRKTLHAASLYKVLRG